MKISESNSSRNFIGKVLVYLAPEFEFCLDDLIRCLEDGEIPSSHTNVELGFETGIIDPETWNWLLSIYSILMTIAAYYSQIAKSERDFNEIKEDLKTIEENQEETKKKIDQLFELAAERLLETDRGDIELIIKEEFSKTLNVSEEN